MSKQINQYSVAFNQSSAKDEQGKSFDIGVQTAAMSIALVSWMIEQKADWVGNVTATDKSSITLNTTADTIKKLTDTFKAEIAAVTLVKENLITLPEPYVKKTRRAGFDS